MGGLNSNDFYRNRAQISAIGGLLSTSKFYTLREISCVAINF